MEWKLFLSTFVLIFVAELGDKTQLAALASAAGSKAPWSVFGGAASALVLSTLIAVLLGSAFSKVAPQHIVKGAAGLLFIGFGVVFLASAVRAAPAAMRQPEAEPKPGALARVALDMSAAFERASSQDYAALARSVADPTLRELFSSLEREEARHLKHLDEMAAQSGSEQAGGTALEVYPEIARPSMISEAEAPDPLAAAVAHERTTADFYTALAQATPFPGVKAAFARLAQEELDHVRRLEEIRPG